MPLFGAVETGGTKIVCAAGTGPDDVRARHRFTTTDPRAAMDEIARFFREVPPVAAIGIASFGPVCLDAGSAHFGSILHTPKIAWRDFPLRSAVREATGVRRVAIDTDVNAAALAEHTWGAARGIGDFIYVTIGTGIGGGVMSRGRPVHGLMHPEIGHMALPRDPARDAFAGCCPSHGDCFEGLACGPAMEQRWGAPAHQLPPGHPAWELEIDYVAAGFTNLVYAVSPKMIVLGGGVSEGLPVERIGAAMARRVAGYAPLPELRRAALGGDAGVLGAIALAAAAE